MSKEQLKENRNLEWNIRVKAALIVVFSKNDDGESVALRSLMRCCVIRQCMMLRMVFGI